MRSLFKVTFLKMGCAKRTSYDVTYVYDGQPTQYKLTHIGGVYLILLFKKRGAIKPPMMGHMCRGQPTQYT